MRKKTVLQGWEHPGTSQIHLLDASTGTILSTFDGPENTSWSHPVVADVNGDGKDEVVVSGFSPSDATYEGQYVLDSNLSLVTYKDDPGQVQFANDLDGDGDIEVVLIDEKVLKVADGTLSEEWRFVAEAPIRSAIVSDTDRNGRNEILLLADRLIVLEGGMEWLDVVINRLPSPPEGFPTIKAYVTVMDEHDQPIQGLTAEDFTVTEEGMDQGGIQVRPVWETGEPVSVVLVLDYSSSMHRNTSVVRNMKAAARSFIALMDSSDRGAIVKFSTEVETVQGFTSDPDQLMKAVNASFSGVKGSTSFYDALYAAAEVCAEESGRKALVIITDAEDNSSSHTQEEVLRKAVETGVSVLAIGLGNVNRSVLTPITTQTGGKAYMAQSSGSDLQEVYELISETLRNQYELTYTTDNLDIEIEARRVVVTATYNSLTGQDGATYRVSPASVEESEERTIPLAYVLYQNHPNPFNATTTITYDLPEAGPVRLAIYALTGQKVVTLVEEIQQAGRCAIQWDASGLGSGVYLCRLVAGEFVETKKMVLIR